MIPLLSPHFAPATDSALLATTVILRMSEQFSELADDAQHHLHGAYCLFATTGEKWSPFHIDVRGVAFWIYLRESIRVCFLNEHGCQFDLGIVDDEKAAASAPEGVWANKISYLIARLCNACWGDFDESVKESMRAEIQTSLEEWKAQLPDTYQPWCFSCKDYEPFPVIKFLSPWHGAQSLFSCSQCICVADSPLLEIAWQQYYTAKVMLAVYASKQREGSSVLTLNQHLEVRQRSCRAQICLLTTALHRRRSSTQPGLRALCAFLAITSAATSTGRISFRGAANSLPGKKSRGAWPNSSRISWTRPNGRIRHATRGSSRFVRSMTAAVT